MAQVRQVISSWSRRARSDPQLTRWPSCFCPAGDDVQRHRYATDNLAATQEALLDKLHHPLAGSLNKTFVLEKFCEQEGAASARCASSFAADRDDINHYLRQLRICHAQYLLQHTERMVSEVAMQCGFEDSNYFSVVFNREMGMTPGQWRHRSRRA
jgi:AraC family L-rhamnose operon transcriptional activator RhaR